MSIDELRAELVRAEALYQICQKHGYADGANAHRATANALLAELRSRRA